MTAMHDYTRPHMTEEAKSVVIQSFEDARLLQEEMLVRAAAFDKE